MISKKTFFTLVIAVLAIGRAVQAFQEAKGAQLTSGMAATFALGTVVCYAVFLLTWYHGTIWLLTRSALGGLSIAFSCAVLLTGATALVSYLPDIFLAASATAPSGDSTWHFGRTFVVACVVGGAMAMTIVKRLRERPKTSIDVER